MHKVIFQTPHARTVMTCDEEYDVLVARMRDIMYCIENNIDTTIRIEEGAKVYCKKFSWITQSEFNRIMKRLKGKNKLGMKQVWVDVEDLGKPKTAHRVTLWELTVNGRTHHEYRNVKPDTDYFNMGIYYTL